MTQPDLHPVCPQRRDAIMSMLCEIEENHDVEILFAVESGSRAWGFASPDSDYDVRFIYVHKRDWYLSVYPGRDVIEHRVDDDLDAAGWDLRKTMDLLSRSNPTLLEWLGSPVVYIRNPVFQNTLVEKAHAYRQNQKVFHHYMGMVHETANRFIAGKEQVKYKKYFYVLRPLLAADWVFNYGTMPPTEFYKLVEGSEIFRKNDASMADLETLMAIKTSSGEAKEGPHSDFPYLNAFLEDYARHLWAQRHDPRLKVNHVFRKQVPMEPLNQFFRKWVENCNDNV